MNVEGNQHEKSTGTPQTETREVDLGEGVNTTETDIAAAAKEAGVNESTHKRLLKETRIAQQELAKAKEELEERKNAELVAQNNWKALAEKLQEENGSLKGSLGELAVKTQLAPKLVEMGCVNVDDAMKLGNNELLVHDDGQISGVDQYIDDLRAQRPYLFQSKIPSSVNTTLPAGGINVTPAKKSVNDLSDDELDAHMKQLDKQERARLGL